MPGQRGHSKYSQEPPCQPALVINAKVRHFAQFLVCCLAMTRSVAKKDSPDSGKKPPFHSKQKVQFLKKNKNPHDEAGHRRLGSCSSKGIHKIEKSDKPILDKVAQSVSSSKIKNPQVYEAQDERTCHEEKLYKIMSDIRLRQDQIITQQNDLKSEVRAIQGYVDDKISSFLEELKAKLDGELRSEVNPGQMIWL
ncbi:Uncharacterized protein Fot_21738 [Forsythia ovata]|uniref:Uncharacterized protein n=1 Tax=Forsythia ovata TaxID=205694 RepID=A0ABD1UVQ0_9LAMI